MVEDARYRTKVYLEEYITDANLTEDDDSTPVYYIIAYEKPSYPLVSVFRLKGVDLVFSILTPTSEPIFSGDHIIRRYKESVPIETFCIDKGTRITGTKLRWKASEELREVFKDHPTGTSERPLKDEAPNDINLGSTTLYSQHFTFNYYRGVT